MSMARFEHVRHKAPAQLDRPRELIVACCPMRSHVNLSRIVRTAGCCGVTRVIVCGRPKLDADITRDSLAVVAVESHRTLAPVLKRLRQEGYTLTGLEQATGAVSLYEYRFDRRSVLVIGNERLGISEDVLDLLDAVIEIPVYGRPFSYNAAAAADMALYEYCRQFPRG